MKKIVLKIFFILVALLPMSSFAQNTINYEEALKKYDSEMIALASKYVEFIGIKDLFEASKQSLNDATKEQIKTNNPKLKKDILDKITSYFVQDYNENSTKDMSSLIIYLTLDIYTKEELLHSIAFYETDIGKTILKKTRNLTDKMATPLEKILEKHMVSSMQKTSEEMKKIGIRFK